MGAKIWLPLGRAPTRTPKTEREQLMQRLYEVRYLVPGAEDLELSYLRDIVQACEEKKRKQDAEDKVKAAAAGKLLDDMDPAQRQGALKEFLKWRKRRRGR